MSLLEIGEELGIDGSSVVYLLHKLGNGIPPKTWSVIDETREPVASR